MVGDSSPLLSGTKRTRRQQKIIKDTDDLSNAVNHLDSADIYERARLGRNGYRVTFLSNAQQTAAEGDHVLSYSCSLNKSEKSKT